MQLFKPLIIPARWKSKTNHKDTKEYKGKLPEFQMAGSKICRRGATLYGPFGTGRIAGKRTRLWRRRSRFLSASIRPALRKRHLGGRNHGKRFGDGNTVVGYVGSSSPDCSRTMYSA